MDCKKRERAENFSNAETRLLLNLVIAYAGIIENRKTGAVMWRSKNDAWEKIANNFNAQSGQIYRSSKVLRSKYDVLKRSLKKKIASNKLEMYKTGGGPYVELPLSDMEEKLKQILSLGIDGLECRNDSDITLINLDQTETVETLFVNFTADEEIRPIPDVGSDEEFLQTSNISQPYELPSTSKVLITRDQGKRNTSTSETSEIPSACKVFKGSEQRGRTSSTSETDEMPSACKVFKASEQRGRTTSASETDEMPSACKVFKVSEQRGRTTSTSETDEVLSPYSFSKKEVRKEKSNIIRKTHTEITETPKTNKNQLYDQYNNVAETRKHLVATQLQLVLKQKEDHEEEHQYKMKNFQIQRQNLELEKENLLLQKDLMFREEARRVEEHGLKMQKLK